jgi:hypothetical protein
MWALAPETEGVTCEIDDPVARALCTDPNLRSLPPRDLAERLGISIAQAQAGILRLASQASGVRVVLRGVSFDEAIAEGGKAMGRHPIAYARSDAGALESESRRTDSASAFAWGILLGAGIVLYIASADEEEEQ